MSEWISCAERMPEIASNREVIFVLGWAEGYPVREYRYSLGELHSGVNGFYWEVVGYPDSIAKLNPSHWMPMPAPPEVSKK